MEHALAGSTVDRGILRALLLLPPLLPLAHVDIQLTSSAYVLVIMTAFHFLTFVQGGLSVCLSVCLCVRFSLALYLFTFVGSRSRQVSHHLKWASTQKKKEKKRRIPKEKNGEKNQSCTQWRTLLGMCPRHNKRLVNFHPQEKKAPKCSLL